MVAARPAPSLEPGHRKEISEPSGGAAWLGVSLWGGKKPLKLTLPFEDQTVFATNLRGLSPSSLWLVSHGDRSWTSAAYQKSTAKAENVMSNHGGEANTDAFADLPGTELTLDAAALILRWRTL